MYDYDPYGCSGMRRLIDGSEAHEHDIPIDLVVHTKVPSKWKLIDLETGQEYIGSDIPTQYGLWIRTKDR